MMGNHALNDLGIEQGNGLGNHLNNESASVLQPQMTDIYHSRENLNDTEDEKAFKDLMHLQDQMHNMQTEYND
jgi:hypothetical protein